jgi:hypothetical protein
MDIKRLNDLMGNDLKTEIEYELPKPHPDEIASSNNLIRYSNIKSLLESKKINQVLQAMNAFDSINPDDLDTYVSLANVVTLGVSQTALEGMVCDDLPDMPEAFLTENSNEFVREFIEEMTCRKFSDLRESSLAMDKKPEDLPDESRGMFDSILNKLGIRSDTLDTKDLLYMYLFQRFLGHRHDVANSRDALGESISGPLNILLEKAPPGMEGWIKSVKKSFMEQYGDDWEEALYSTAWKKYEEGKSGKIKEAKEPKESNDASTPPDDSKCPEVPKKVKDDVAVVMKELNDKIEIHKSKQTFDTYKPSFYNAKDALELIMSKCGEGTMEKYKWAQIHFTKLKSPVTDYFPASLVKYLAHGDAEDVLKEV